MIQGYDFDDAIASLSDITEEHDYGDTDADSDDNFDTPARFVIDDAVRMEDMVARLVRVVHSYSFTLSGSDCSL